MVTGTPHQRTPYATPGHLSLSGDRYTKRLTANALEGDEAAELTAAKYGRSEWWLLLEP